MLNWKAYLNNWRVSKDAQQTEKKQVNEGVCLSAVI